MTECVDAVTAFRAVICCISALIAFRVTDSLCTAHRLGRYTALLPEQSHCSHLMHVACCQHCFAYVHVHMMYHIYDDIYPHDISCCMRICHYSPMPFSNSSCCGEGVGLQLASSTFSEQNPASPHLGCSRLPCSSYYNLHRRI